MSALSHRDHSVSLPARGENRDECCGGKEGGLRESSDVSTISFKVLGKYRGLPTARADPSWAVGVCTTQAHGIVKSEDLMGRDHTSRLVPTCYIYIGQSTDLESGAALQDRATRNCKVYKYRKKQWAYMLRRWGERKAC